MQSRYLLRRDGRYYFRIRIPLDLRRWFGPREEIKKSLKTNGYNDAKSLARAWLYRSERLFTRLRSAMVTDDQIRQLVTDYLDETLSESEERRLGGGGLYADDGDGEHGTSVIDFRSRAKVIGVLSCRREGRSAYRTSFRGIASGRRRSRQAAAGRIPRRKIFPPGRRGGRNGRGLPPRSLHRSRGSGAGDARTGTGRSVARPRTAGVPGRA